MQVSHAIQNVKSAEGAKEVVEEVVEKALPSVTDAVRGGDEGDVSRRGIGVVPVIRGVSNVPARATTCWTSWARKRTASCESSAV